MAIGRYTVQQGDTIRRIALAQLGFADQWWVLAVYNELDYPYVDAGGLPSAGLREAGLTYPGLRVLGLGDVLLIPTSPDDPVTRKAAATQDPDPYVALFGTDLLVTDLGDLQANDGSGDWSVTAGVNNLLQALQHRLLTRKGELPYHPEYGSNLEQHIGTALDAGRMQLIRLEVIDALMADPRITAIQNVTMLDNGNHVDLVVTAQVIGSDDVVPLNLVIPAVGA